MTTTFSRWRVLLAITIGVLCCGIPLWPIPYSKVSLPVNPSGWLWMFGAALSAAFTVSFLRMSVRASTFSLTLGFVLAVMARVVVETSLDPTSHNLWPFEVVIAGGIGFVGALIGALLARISARVRGSQL